MKKGGEQNTIYMFLSIDPHSYIDIVHLLIHRPWPAPMHSHPYPATLNTTQK